MFREVKTYYVGKTVQIYISDHHLHQMFLQDGILFI